LEFNLRARCTGARARTSRRLIIHRAYYTISIKCFSIKIFILMNALAYVYLRAVKTANEKLRLLREFVGNYRFSKLVSIFIYLFIYFFLFPDRELLTWPYGFFFLLIFNSWSNGVRQRWNRIAWYCNYDGKKKKIRPIISRVWKL
jgi:hypothetical protein